MTLKHLLPILAVAVCSTAMGGPGKTEAGWNLMGAVTKSQGFLGSEDIRHGNAWFVGYGRPEPRFQIGAIPAQWVWSAYVMPSKGNYLDGIPGFHTTAYGILSHGRWRWPTRDGVGAYVDAGLGVQYVNRLSRDINTRYNSTPYAAIGVGIQTGRTETLIGVGFLHVSNAGTKRPNQGQNHLMLMVGVRF